MFPFWIDLEVTTAFQVLAASIAAVVCLLTLFTGRPYGA